MRLIRFFLQLVVLFTLCKPVCAQTPEIALDYVRENYATEKLFIHYDKTSYVAGETIWFKAYIVSGFLPSPFSFSLNVELINDSGVIVEKKILPVINSVASGNFDLDANAAQMNYTVRAYSRHMINFGESNFYSQIIPVFNPADTKPNVLPAKEYVCSFLPESGNLIAGLKNTVAFKCTDQWGYPESAAGIIVNSTGQQQATFSSSHDGMGKFEITPVTGETYTAISKINNSVTVKTKLPAVIASAAMLNVKKENGRTYFYVNSETIFNEEMQPAYLLAVMENVPVFNIPLAKTQKNFKGQIPVTDIPSGILQLTLFNSKNQPLCERLIFILNDDFKALSNFKAVTSSTSARAKNEYSFELQDSLDGTFSVAVTDADMELAPNNAGSIISRFLLTNDIKGYVHNPGYFFENRDEDRQNNLDLVMLTNGWRKFNWGQVINKRLPVLPKKDPNFITLKGTAFNESTNVALGETNVSLFIKSKEAGNNLIIVPVSSSGEFEVDGLLFRDTATLYFQNLLAKNKRLTVTQNSQSMSESFSVNNSSKFSDVKPLSFTMADDKLKDLYTNVLDYNNNKKTIVLDEVKLVSKAKNPTKLVEERYIRNGVFNSYAAKTLDFINDPSAANNGTNILEYIKGRLSGVTVSGSGSNYTLNYRASMSLRSGMIPMNVFLDESQVSASDVANIPMSEIAMVKLYSTGFIGAESGGAGGTLAIYTKRGDDFARIPGEDNLFKLKLEGYAPIKEFFSPDYSLKNSVQRGADMRTTLYWEPNLETSQTEKKLSFSFYNADRVKRIKVILEGMTSDGKLVHLERIVE